MSLLLLSMDKIVVFPLVGMTWKIDVNYSASACGDVDLDLISVASASVVYVDSPIA